MGPVKEKDESIRETVHSVFIYLCYINWFPAEVRVSQEQENSNTEQLHCRSSHYKKN
jgi:hypothetical protein